jgi:hypothetical protein
MPVPDFSPGEVLTAAAMDSIGLWLIEKKDVVTAGTIDFTSVFSSDYSGYRLLMDYTHVTTAGELRFQFRDSGGVIATNYFWNWSGQYNASGTPTFASYSYQSTAAQTSSFVSTATVGGRCFGSFDIINPQNTAPCALQGSWASPASTTTITYANIVGNAMHNASVSRTGLRLSATAGTVTGKFSLYGYRN